MKIKFTGKVERKNMKLENLEKMDLAAFTDGLAHIIVKLFGEKYESSVYPRQAIAENHGLELPTEYACVLTKKHYKVVVV